MGQKINPISHRLAISRDWSSLWFKKKNNYGLWFLQENYITSYFTYFFNSFGIFISWINSQRNNDIFFVFFMVWKETDTSLRLHENEKKVLQYRLFVNKIIKYDHYYYFYKNKENSGLPFFIKDLLFTLQQYLNFPIILWVYPLDQLEFGTSASVLLNFFASRLNFSKFFSDNKFSVLIQQIIFETCFNNAKIEGLKFAASGRVKLGQTIAKAELFSFGRLSLHTYHSKINFAHGVVATKYGSVGLKLWVLLLFF